MQKLLALTLPNGQSIPHPSQVPEGGIDELTKIIKLGVTLAFIFGILLALAFIIIAGIQWITSGGDDAKITAARSKIIYAIIGIVIIFLAFFIINIIGYFFNIELLSIT